MSNIRTKWTNKNRKPQNCLLFKNTKHRSKRSSQNYSESLDMFENTLLSEALPAMQNMRQSEDCKLSYEIRPIDSDTINTLIKQRFDSAREEKESTNSCNSDRLQENRNRLNALSSTITEVNSFGVHHKSHMAVNISSEHSLIIPNQDPKQTKPKVSWKIVSCRHYDTYSSQYSSRRKQQYKKTKKTSALLKQILLVTQEYVSKETPRMPWHRDHAQNLHNSLGKNESTLSVDIVESKKPRKVPVESPGSHRSEAVSDQSETDGDDPSDRDGEGPTSSVESVATMCRICRDAESPSPESGELVSACRCRGTVGRQHVRCLERWLTESGNTSCELCGFNYSIRCVQRYGVARSFIVWAITHNPKQFLMDGLGIMLVSPLAMLAAWLSGRTLAALMATDLPDSLAAWPLAFIFVIACFTLVCYYCWVMAAMTRHALGWLSWHRTQYDVRLLHIHDTATD